VFLYYRRGGDSAHGQEKKESSKEKEKITGVNQVIFECITIPFTAN